MISSILSKNSVTLVDPTGKTFVVTGTHLNYDKIRAAVIAGDLKKAVKLVDVTGQIEKATRGKGLKIFGGVVYYSGQAINNAVTRVILSTLEEADRLKVKADIKPVYNFLSRMVDGGMEERQINELWAFIDASALTLLPDGRFIAYKKVRDDYKDIYSGTFLNKPGKKVKMDRDDVDPDRYQTCSYGLHVCSEGYLDQYGTGDGPRTMIVAVDPKDVIAVPADHNNQKMRVCEYEVLFEREGDPHSTQREFAGIIKPNKLVTPDEACRILGISKDSLRKRLNRGVTVRRFGEMVEFI